MDTIEPMKSGVAGANAMAICCVMPGRRVIPERRLMSARCVMPGSVARGAVPSRGSASHAERGIALAISLVLLVVLTILGVATLSGSRITEKITSNAQQKAIAFEAAESAINSVWSVADLLDAVRDIPTENYAAPPPIPQTAIGVQLSSELTQTTGSSTTVNIDANVSVQYCGEDPRPVGSSISAEEGGQVQFVSLLVNVNGVATIANSRTRSDHVQRGAITSPRTDRQSVCVSPGLLRASSPEEAEADDET